MTANRDLMRVVFRRLFIYLAKVDMGIRAIEIINHSFARDFVFNNSELLIDKLHIAVLGYNDVASIGYDFYVEDERGKNSRNLYQATRNRLRSLTNSSGLPSLVSNGITDERYGWMLAAGIGSNIEFE